MVTQGVAGQLSKGVHLEESTGVLWATFLLAQESRLGMFLWHGGECREISRNVGSVLQSWLRTWMLFLLPICQKRTSAFFFCLSPLASYVQKITSQFLLDPSQWELLSLCIVYEYSSWFKTPSDNITCIISFTDEHEEKIMIPLLDHSILLDAHSKLLMKMLNSFGFLQK